MEVHLGRDWGPVSSVEVDGSSFSEVPGGGVLPIFSCRSVVGHRRVSILLRVSGD